MTNMRRILSAFLIAAMVLVGGAAGVNVDGPVDAGVTAGPASADTPGSQSKCLHTASGQVYWGEHRWDLIGWSTFYDYYWNVWRHLHRWDHWQWYYGTWHYLHTSSTYCPVH